MKEFHEIANIFPLMEGQGYKDLVTDIAQNGLINPIILYDGKILDGRNRYRACMEIGILPDFQEYAGTDPLQFVISLNLKRRHMNESQRASVASRIANMKNGEFHGNQHLVSANLQTPQISQAQAAEMMNVSPRLVASAKAVEHDAPELIPQIDNGEMTIHEAEKIIRAERRDKERKELAESAQQIKPDDRWNIYLADMATWKAPRQYDYIITDPPYPREYLPLYETLAVRAIEWLKPGGLLIAMCGQSYLNQIYEMMSKHLTYYWTAAYLLPGQPTPLRTRQVNTSWKPLLIFTNGDYKGKIFGDVFKSDGNDKDFHKWGQSVSGMKSIISQVCLPGNTILDPFCGAGTTGVAALSHGCLFDGLDILEENVGISKARLADDSTS